MTNLITHRGPDDSGHYINEAVGLGFRRLSIIDLKTGHQPLSNEDETIWIVFNGEIYNHNPLRQDLQRKGHSFKTKTDTETIVHLYEEYGTKCVDHLRGMFAFAIWDERNELLFCARDRFGIKPFFYYLDNDSFIFGSEIKCILSQLENKPNISLAALDHYLTYGYTSQTDSIYNNILKLKPAHSVVVQKPGRADIRRYWNISYEPDYTKSEADWCRLLEEKLSETVNSHLMSDVPLGAFLSGGIDSSAVVALMSKFSNAPVKTFSIGFKEAEFNELEYAREVASRYKTEHHERIVEPESVDLLPKLIDAYDEPFADSSAIPTYFVSKFAREFVTVALSGDGGDELFIGYNHYQKFNTLRNYNVLPDSFGKLVWGSTHSVIPNGVKGKGLAYYLSKPKNNLLAYQAIWNIHDRKKLFRKEYWDILKNSLGEQEKEKLLQVNNSSDFLFNMQQLDMQTYMVDDILTKVDRASMQNSLEVRVPLLDHEFAELTFKIPSEMKLKGNEKKYILKKAMQNHLPNSILSHKKQGFGLPMNVWFKEDLKEYVNDRLLNPESPLYEYFNQEYIKQVIREHNYSMRDFNKKIWSLIFLDQWFTSRQNASMAPRSK